MYQTDVDGSIVTVTEDNDDGTKHDLAGESVDVADIEPPFRVVVTEDGELTAYTMGSEETPRLRAHLSESTDQNALVDALYW